MKLIKLLGFYALIIAFFACGNTSNKVRETDIHENWKTLEESNYSIQYPDSFVLDKSGRNGARFVLLSQKTSKMDLFRENVNLLIQNLRGKNIDLDKYVEISEDQISTMLSDGKLVESERLYANGKDFHRIVYTTNDFQRPLECLQYYWIENEKAYVLTLTCEVNQYDNYVSVGEEIMKTFRFK